ncbi:unnamed protein product [Pseudo-nitzschia multistriata]|uniref:SAP domain-containing protein n=1 Tax=Pseudo-nitzschia multistriata TaxID=183589 RepID=A0A448Z435_9STRA|nr:unnamed protein product [Pseudo-nitzschia multistriata]
MRKEAARNNSVPEEVTSPGFPLLVHIQIWLRRNQKELAAGLTHKIDSSPFLGEEIKDEAWSNMWNYILAEGMLFLDGNDDSPGYLKKRDFLYNHIAVRMSQKARLTMMNFYQDVANKIWELEDARLEEKQYVTLACQQTVLRLLLKICGLGSSTILIFVEETTWPVEIPGGSSAKDLNFWGSNFLSKTQKIPSTLIDETTGLVELLKLIDTAPEATGEDDHIEAVLILERTQSPSLRPKSSGCLEENDLVGEDDEESGEDSFRAFNPYESSPVGEAEVTYSPAGADTFCEEDGLGQNVDINDQEDDEIEFRESDDDGNEIVVIDDDDASNDEVINSEDEDGMGDADSHVSDDGDDDENYYDGNEDEDVICDVDDDTYSDDDKNECSEGDNGDRYEEIEVLDNDKVEASSQEKLNATGDDSDQEDDRSRSVTCEETNLGPRYESNIHPSGHGNDEVDEELKKIVTKTGITENSERIGRDIGFDNSINLESTVENVCHDQSNSWQEKNKENKGVNDSENEALDRVVDVDCHSNDADLSASVEDTTIFMGFTGTDKTPPEKSMAEVIQKRHSSSVEAPEPNEAGNEECVSKLNAADEYYATDIEHEHNINLEKVGTEVAAVGGEFGDTTEEEDESERFRANRTAQADRRADALRSGAGYASQVEDGYEPEDTHGYTEEEVSEAFHTEDEEDERLLKQKPRLSDTNSDVENGEPKRPFSEGSRVIVENAERQADIEPASDDMDMADERTEQEEDVTAEFSELEENPEGSSELRIPTSESLQAKTLLEFAQKAQMEPILENTDKEIKNCEDDVQPDSEEKSPSDEAGVDSYADDDEYAAEGYRSMETEEEDDTEKRTSASGFSPEVVPTMTEYEKDRSNIGSENIEISGAKGEDIEVENIVDGMKSKTSTEAAQSSEDEGDGHLDDNKYIEKSNHEDLSIASGEHRQERAGSRNSEDHIELDIVEDSPMADESKTNKNKSHGTEKDLSSKVFKDSWVGVNNNDVESCNHDVNSVVPPERFEEHPVGSNPLEKFEEHQKQILLSQKSDVSVSDKAEKCDEESAFESKTTGIHDNGVDIEDSSRNVGGNTSADIELIPDQIDDVLDSVDAGNTEHDGTGNDYCKRKETMAEDELKTNKQDNSNIVGKGSREVTERETNTERNQSNKNNTRDLAEFDDSKPDNSSLKKNQILVGGGVAKNFDGENHAALHAVDAALPPESEPVVRIEAIKVTEESAESDNTTKAMTSDINAQPKVALYNKEGQPLETSIRTDEINKEVDVKPDDSINSNDKSVSDSKEIDLCGDIVIQETDVDGFTDILMDTKGNVGDINEDKDLQSEHIVNIRVCDNNYLRQQPLVTKETPQDDENAAALEKKAREKSDSQLPSVAHLEVNEKMNRDDVVVKNNTNRSINSKPDEGKFGEPVAMNTVTATLDDHEVEELVNLQDATELSPAFGQEDEENADQCRQGVEEPKPVELITDTTNPLGLSVGDCVIVQGKKPGSTEMLKISSVNPDGTYGVKDPFTRRKRKKALKPSQIIDVEKRKLDDSDLPPINEEASEINSMDFHETMELGDEPPDAPIPEFIGGEPEQESTRTSNRKRKPKNSDGGSVSSSGLPPRPPPRGRSTVLPLESKQLCARSQKDDTENDDEGSIQTRTSTRSTRNGTRKATVRRTTTAQKDEDIGDDSSVQTQSSTRLTRSATRKSSARTRNAENEDINDEGSVQTQTSMRSTRSSTRKPTKRTRTKQQKIDDIDCENSVQTRTSTRSTRSSTRKSSARKRAIEEKDKGSDKEDEVSVQTRTYTTATRSSMKKSSSRPSARDKDDDEDASVQTRTSTRSTRSTAGRTHIHDTILKEKGGCHGNDDASVQTRTSTRSTRGKTKSHPAHDEMLKEKDEGSVRSRRNRSAALPKNEASAGAHISDAFSAWTKAKLKEELKKRGISHKNSMLKKELVELLQRSMSETN